jgi:rhodanese-related sulfurtransferase
LILAALSLLVGCTQIDPAIDGSKIGADFPAYGLVAPADAARVIEILQDDPQFVLLDIRTPSEVASQHLAGAIDLDSSDPLFAETLASWDRQKTYLIYCRSGNRTRQARTLMTELGFERVYELQGGINAWNAAGLPICVGPLDDDHECVLRSSDT